MKPTAINLSPCRRNAAFTLMEMMVGTGIFLGIFVGVLVGFQLFGLKVYTLAATKLSATADARKSLNVLREQIRSSKLVYVGNFTGGTFSRIANGQPQTGNALELFFADANDNPDTNATIYYQQTSGTTNAIYSISNNVVSRVANYVTNNIVFTAEDYQAQTLSDYNNNPVIRVAFQFYEWQYPIGFLGTNGLNAYNHYRLQTRIARRAKQ